MKILHTVEFYTPSLGGAQEVVRQLSERMAAGGHEVTVATTRLPERQSRLINDVNIEEFDVSGNEVRGYEGGDIERYKQFLQDSDFDVIMNYAVQQWATDLFIEVMDRVKGGKVLVPCGFSGLYLPEYKDYFAKMPQILKSYDATVYLSNDYRDINFARQHGIKNTHVIPNGAGADEFLAENLPDVRQQLAIKDSDFFIFSVGSHTGSKGHAEAIEIFKRADIQDAVLVIEANSFGGGCTQACRRAARWFGFNPRARRQRKRLIVTSLPDRQAVVAAYRQADLFLFPSNIEASPLVLFESMAAKLPFLSTDVGNAKEIIEWSDGGLLLPTSKDKQGQSHADIIKSTALVEKMYHDEAARKKLGAAGFKAWKSKFSWEIITTKYLELYQGLIRR